MAKYVGKSASFTIADSGSTSRDLSSYITSVDGLPGSVDTPETTGLGSSAKSYIGGLADAPFSLKGMFDDTATSGPDVVLSGILGVSKAFTFGPGGTTTGFRKYSGNAILKAYKISAPVAGLVTFSADFVTTGAVAVGTY